MTLTNNAPDFESINQALAAPARRAILAHVDGEWMTISELARVLKLAVSTISHHVQVLRWAGLVLVERRGREAHVTARFRDHQIVIAGRPAPVPAWIEKDGQNVDPGRDEPAV